MANSEKGYEDISFQSQLESGEVTVASADGTIDVTNPVSGGTNLAVNIDGTTIVKDNSGVLSANLELTKLTDAEITALHDANVKEAYKVIYSTDTNRTAIGDTVKIYKDQTLKSASFANQILTLTYILADGSESPVNIDMSSLIEEQEVENGIQVNDHKLSIKLDTTGDDTGSGKFLTVGANGLKLDGVTDAIAAAVNALNATVTNTVGTDGLSLSITEANGVITEISGSIAANTYDAYGAATDAVEALNATPSQAAAAGNGQLALSLTQVDGLITEISGSIAANTYDAYGAAATAKSEVIGASTDTKDDDTINGAKAYADAAIAALDKSDTAATDQFVTAVSESDGIITVLRARPTAANVSFSNSYFDQEHTTNVEEALIELAEFDCGTY